MKHLKISLIGENLCFFFNQAKTVHPEVIYDKSNKGVGWEMFSPPPARSFVLNLKIEIQSIHGNLTKFTIVPKT